MKNIGTALVVMALVAAAAGAQESQSAGDAKTQIFVNGLFNPQTFSFVDRRTLTLFVEDGSYAGAWSSATGGAFGFGVTRNITTVLSVGAAVDIVNADADQSFAARIPHPLFFNQHRTLEADQTELSYKETAIHFLVGYTKVTERIVLSVTGGPSYFITRTELIEDFTFTQSYPFDEVGEGSIDSRRYDANGFGFNVGAWVGYRFHKNLAAGGDLRFSSATNSFTTGNGTEIEVNAGGFRVGGGIRILF